MIRIPLLLGLATALAAGEVSPPRVLVLLADNFHHGEFMQTWLPLRAMGYAVDIAAPERGTVYRGERGRPSNPDNDANANLALSDVTSPDPYLALVIPGGFSPGNLEKHERSLAICRAFMAAGKPIAAVCHGPRLLMRAGLLKDRVATCLYTVADELADAWKEGAYGRWVDQPVVVDRNLFTGRFPGDTTPLIRALLTRLAGEGGRPVPGGGRVLVLALGTPLTGHAKWALRDAPGIGGVTVALAERAEDLGKVDAASCDGLVILPPGESVVLGKVPGLTALAADLDRRGRPVIAVKRAAAAAKDLGLACQAVEVDDGYVEYLRPIVDAARGLPEVEVPRATPAVAIRVAPGFDDRAFVAVRLIMDRAGTASVVLAQRPGWILGKEGLPIEATQVKASSSQVYIVGPPGPDPVQGPANPEWEELLRHAKARPQAAERFDAALALREGFDDHAALALFAYCGSRGWRLAVVAQTAGPQRGLNGVTLEASHTYAEPPPLTERALVLAPGGLWPEAGQARQAVQPDWVTAGQAARDAQRERWLLDRYAAGAVLMTVGLDSLRLGRCGEFKGHSFAAPDPTVWSFGRNGGGHSGAPALRSGERLVSVKDLGGLAAGLTLVEAELAAGQKN